MPYPRDRLLRRIEAEARAFANGDSTASQLRLGRVYRLLEAGALAGYWQKRDADAAAELIRHKYRLSRVRDVLLRGDSVTVWKVTDVAEFLGLSTQRGGSARPPGAASGAYGPVWASTPLGAVGNRSLGRNGVVE